MVSLQRNWFPAMKVNCYDMILMLHVLPWIEYYKVLQQITMGQKAKPDFVARMGSFDDAECFDAFVRMRMHQAWSSALILLMAWPLTNPLDLQKINAIMQRNRLRIPGAEANSLEYGLPRFRHESVHKILQGLPKVTGNHQPPTHTLSKMAKVWIFNCVTPQDIPYLFSNEPHSCFI